MLGIVLLGTIYDLRPLFWFIHVHALLLRIPNKKMKKKKHVMMEASTDQLKSLLFSLFSKATVEAKSPRPFRPPGPLPEGLKKVLKSVGFFMRNRGHTN